MAAGERPPFVPKRLLVDGILMSRCNMQASFEIISGRRKVKGNPGWGGSHGILAEMQSCSWMHSKTLHANFTGLRPGTILRTNNGLLLKWHIIRRGRSQVRICYLSSATRVESLLWSQNLSSTAKHWFIFQTSRHLSCHARALNLSTHNSMPSFIHTTPESIVITLFDANAAHGKTILSCIIPR